MHSPSKQQLQDCHPNRYTKQYPSRRFHPTSRFRNPKQEVGNACRNGRDTRHQTCRRWIQYFSQMRLQWKRTETKSQKIDKVGCPGEENRGSRSSRRHRARFHSFSISIRSCQTTSMRSLYCIKRLSASRHICSQCWLRVPTRAHTGQGLIKSKIGSAVSTDSRHVLTRIKCLS